MGLTLGGVFFFLGGVLSGGDFLELSLLGLLRLLLSWTASILRMAALIMSRLALVGTVVVVFFLWVQDFWPFFLLFTGGGAKLLGSFWGCRRICLHIILISGRRAALLNQAGVEKSTTDQFK